MYLFKFVKQILLKIYRCIKNFYRFLETCPNCYCFYRLSVNLPTAGNLLETQIMWLVSTTEVICSLIVCMCGNNVAQQEHTKTILICNCWSTRFKFGTEPKLQTIWREKWAWVGTMGQPLNLGSQNIYLQSSKLAMSNVVYSLCVGGG